MSKLPEHLGEGKGPLFEAEEVRSAENELGREQVDAEDLLAGEPADPFTNNPYRPAIQAELKAISKYMRPDKALEQLEKLVVTYRATLDSIQRKLEYAYFNNQPGSAELLHKEFQLSQALDWLEGYVEAKLVNPRALARQVAAKEDYREYLKRTQAMLEDLAHLAEQGNACAAYVWEHWRKVRLEMSELTRQAEYKFKPARAALLEGIVNGWLSEATVQARPTRGQESEQVMRLINSWLPPEPGKA